MNSAGGATRENGTEGRKETEKKDRQAYRNNSKEISDRFVNTELNIQRYKRNHKHFGLDLCRWQLSLLRRKSDAERHITLS